MIERQFRGPCHVGIGDSCGGFGGPGTIPAIWVAGSEVVEMELDPPWGRASRRYRCGGDSCGGFGGPGAIPAIWVAGTKWSRWNSTLHEAVPAGGISVAAVAAVVLEGRVPSRPFGLLFYPPRLMRCMGLWLTTARVPRAPAMPMSRAPARGTSSHRA